MKLHVLHYFNGTLIQLKYVLASLGISGKWECVESLYSVQCYFYPDKGGTLSFTPGTHDLDFPDLEIYNLEMTGEWGRFNAQDLLKEFGIKFRKGTKELNHNWEPKEPLTPEEQKRNEENQAMIEALLADLG